MSEQEGNVHSHLDIYGVVIEIAKFLGLPEYLVNYTLTFSKTEISTLYVSYEYFENFKDKDENNNVKGHFICIEAMDTIGGKCDVDVGRIIGRFLGLPPHIINYTLQVTAGEIPIVKGAFELPPDSLMLLEKVKKDMQDFKEEYKPQITFADKPKEKINE